MLRVPAGDLAGHRLTLEPFQRRFIRRCFGRRRARRAILSIGRRNGKTALSSVIALAALYGPLVRPNSLVISASRSREQAALVWHYAAQMAQLSGHDRILVTREAKKEIFCPATGVTYRAVSADAVRALGFGPRLVIHDELGQVRGPRDDLYDALSTSLGSYSDALEIIISTQAASDSALLSLLIDNPGKDTVVDLYAGADECKLDDRRAWRAANPALGIYRSLEDFERLAQEAAILPTRANAFRNFFLNQRRDATASWLSRAAWDRCAADVDLEAFSRGRVFAGLDLGARQDLTALVFVAEDLDRSLHVLPFVFTPADTIAERSLRDRAPYDVWAKLGYLEALPGASMRYDGLAARVIALCARYRPESVQFDRWRISELEYEIAKHADSSLCPLVPCGQGYADISPALEATEDAILAAELRHGAHPVLTAAVANAITDTDPAGNRKLTKARSPGRIDPAVALVMAIRGARVKVEPAGAARSLGVVTA